MARRMRSRSKLELGRRRELKRQARQLIKELGNGPCRTPLQVARLLGLNRDQVRAAELAAIGKIVRWACAQQRPKQLKVRHTPRPD